MLASKKLGAATVLALASQTVAQTQIQVAPTKTCLKSCTGVAVQIEGLSWNPGTLLKMTQLGALSFQNGGPDNIAATIVVVFSATDDYDTNTSNLNRVDDAIDAGLDDAYSSTGLVCSPPTASEIPQDFAVYGSASAGLSTTGYGYTVVRVPEGAEFMFLTPNDTYWADNSDPNGDYKLQIEVLCPADMDGSGSLTANDFSAFADAYAAGDLAANCDGSTGSPLLTANDYACFIDAYAAGCT